MRTFLPLLSALAISAACAACGGADDPLGGPYGGSTGSNPAPSSGAAASSGSTSGTDGIAGNNGTDDGGASSSTSTGSTGAGSTGTGSTGTGSTGTGSTGTGTGSGSGSGTGSGTGTGTGTSTAPTWTQIYTSYFATGTIGGCGASGCHSQMKTASGAYSWLSSKGQIDGTSSSALGDPSQSILSWMGGNMPRSGPSSNAAATADVEAWAAAGAQNN